MASPLRLALPRCIQQVACILISRDDLDVQDIATAAEFRKSPWQSLSFSQSMSFKHQSNKPLRISSEKKLRI